MGLLDELKKLTKPYDDEDYLEEDLADPVRVPMQDNRSYASYAEAPRPAEPAQAARLARADNLVRIELAGVQHRGVFVAKAPFPIRVGVEPPMDDAVYFRSGRKPRCQRRTWHRTRRYD